MGRKNGSAAGRAKAAAGLLVRRAPLSGRAAEVAGMIREAVLAGCEAEIDLGGGRKFSVEASPGGVLRVFAITTTTDTILSDPIGRALTADEAARLIAAAARLD